MTDSTAGRDAIVAGSSGPESATMSAGRGPQPRGYSITSPIHDLYFERVCTLVEMLEHPFAKAAPVGAMLIRDADDGSHGVLVAERVIDGWLLKDVS